MRELREARDPCHNKFEFNQAQYGPFPGKVTSRRVTDENSPVKVLVPAPAGGTADIVARVVADALAAEIGQPVIVENKPGAGGAIAVEALKTAPADGQTLLIAASNILTEVPLVMKTRFDPVKDVKPVTMVGRANMVLVAASSVPANDLKGLVGYL